MEIAIFADIHSNVEALKACYEEAKRRSATEFIFLGDYLGDMAKPKDTLKLLHEIEKTYPCTFIRGNKENYWIHHRENSEEEWKMGTTTTGMLAYNFSQLSDEDIDFFEAMPISKEMRYGNLPVFTICHGSPLVVNQSLRPDYGYIDDVVEKFTTQMVICGHFHIQTSYERKGKLVINPGAIGVPLHSAGKAQFLILSDENMQWKTEFVTVPYDVEKTLEDMDKEELFQKAPGWYEITKHLLLTGETSHAVVVRRIMKQYQEKTGKKGLHEIPETFWREETKKLWFT